ncbi:class A beta-lactamase [Actinomadura flavalba]|uniref:class A beta-lactamase n=1 Tax=Actinomadura flavalba TaxID=1120938 RepID=UPI0003A4B65D|nr:class A beta-lactamase [Actinomadura flavalba]
MRRQLWLRTGVTALALGALATGGVHALGAGAEPDRAARPAERTSAAVAANPGLDRALRALEKSYDGRIGAVGIDLGTGRTVGYRADERFPFNSVFKAFACAAVLHKARNGSPGLMDRIVRWTPSEVAELKENSPETTEYTDTGMTPAQFCRAGITRSDGFAGNMMLRQIGGPAGLTAFFRAQGDRTSRLDRPEPGLTEWSPGERRDTTSPAAAARTFSALTAGGALHPDDRARLVGWLKATVTGDKRIRAGLPKTWTVGDKTGTGGASNHGTANDLAIVWPPGATAPIILSIFTNRTADNTPAEEKVIASTATALARALGKL